MTEAVTIAEIEIADPALVEDPAVTNPLYRKTEAEGQLKIISERMPWVRSVSVGLWVTTGSVFEADAEAGISHMLEHMVFKGTAKRTGLEIAEAIEGVGGQINAFTSKELTCYYAQILDDHLDLATDVLCDLLITPNLSEDDLQKEKLVITEEIRHYEDTPHELIYDYFSEVLYGKHPLARPIMGTTDTVGSMERGQLQSYLSHNYSRDRIVVAAAGNLEHKALVDQIDKRLTRRNTKPTANRVPEVEYPSPKKELFPRTVQGVHLCRGVPGVSFGDDRKLAAGILANMMGGGMSSRLFQRIREKEGLAYNVYSFLDTLRDTGVFGTYVGTDPNKADLVGEILDEEYTRFLTEGIKEDELNRSKEQLKGNLMLGLEGTSGRMFRLAKLEIYLGRYLTLDQTLELIDAVTTDDIMELADNFLRPQKQYTAIILPKEERHK